VTLIIIASVVGGVYFAVCAGDLSATCRKAPAALCVALSGALLSIPFIVILGAVK